MMRGGSSGGFGKPTLDGAPQAPFRRSCFGSVGGGAGCCFASGDFKIALLGVVIVAPSTFDLHARPFRSPFDAVVSYPVVGLTGKAPVADGGVERDRLAIEHQRPVRGPYRRYDLVPASAIRVVDFITSRAARSFGASASP